MNTEDLEEMKRRIPPKQEAIGTKYYNSYANGYDDGYNEAIDDVIEMLKEDERR